MVCVNDIYVSAINGNEFRVLWMAPENDLLYIFELIASKLPVLILQQ